MLFVPDHQPEYPPADRMQDGKDKQAAQPAAPGEITQRNQPIEHQQPDNPGEFKPGEIKAAGEQDMCLIL